MNKYNYIIILLSIVFQGNTQILTNLRGEITHSNIVFNEVFISKNKIKIIEGKIQVKPQFKMMIDEGLNTHYEFDINGKLIKHYFTQKNAQTNKIDNTVK